LRCASVFEEIERECERRSADSCRRRAGALPRALVGVLMILRDGSLRKTRPFRCGICPQGLAVAGFRVEG